METSFSNLKRSSRVAEAPISRSSIAPSQPESTAAEPGGVGYLDAPVLGRPRGVGSWTLPVGGEEAGLRRAEPVLRVVASRIVPMGPPGSGNTVQLPNNLMFGAINGVTAEVFALAERVGMEPELFFETVVDSGAATVSGLFRDIGPRMVAGDFEPAFSIDNLEKDNGLGLAMADETGLRLEVIEAAQRLNRRARQAGLGDRDTAAVLRVVEAPDHPAPEET